MIRVILGWLFLVFITNGCTVPIEDRLLGEWRLDSAYYFYNNFEFADDDWHQDERYYYAADGILYTKAVNSAISSRYIVEGTQLIYLDEQGNAYETHEIVKLTKNQMALKAEKAPLFQGPNQTRYEVRYFSKVEGLDSGEKDFP